MINSNNLIVLEGNLVADPEQVSDGILTFRIAVNKGGYENNSVEAGFFSVKVFYSGCVPSHAEFIKRQIESGGFAKGSRVAVVGQIRQERWKSSDDGNRDKILIIANSVEYAGFKQDDEEGGDQSKSSNSSAGAAASSNDIPDAF